MEKRAFTTAAFIIGLLCVAVTEAHMVKPATANPFIDYRQISPPVHPTINLISPAENNTLFNSSKLTIGFNVSLDSEITWITTIYYKASWQADNITLYRRSVDGHDAYINEYSRNLSLTGVPEGNQTITFTVKGEGGYSDNAVYYYFFSNVTSTITFAIDTTSPIVSVLELKNQTYAESEVPLNFNVNEPVSKVSYVLDGKENVTIDGSIMLTGISNGEHNITVYAWDLAGNVGSSDTVTFTEAKREPSAPFPTAPVTAASVASVVSAAAGVLFYIKRRKRQPFTAS